MNLKLTLLIVIGIAQQVLSNNNTDEYINDFFTKKSFTDTLTKSPGEFIKKISIAKHLRDTFSELINIPRVNVSEGLVRKNLFDGFAYIKEAFEFIEKLNWDSKDNNYSDQVMNVTENCKNSMFDFFQSLDDVESVFDTLFLNYLKTYGEYKIATKNFFNENIVSKNKFCDSVLNLQLYTLPSPNMPAIDRNITDNIFKIYSQCFENISDKFYCNRMPLSNQLFKLYERTLLGVIKGYTIMIVGHDFLNMQKNKYDLYTEIEKEYYNEYASTIRNIAISAARVIDKITTAHKAYKKCDPIKWTGSNYIRVKNYVSSKFNAFKIGKKSDFKLKKNLKPEYECDDYTVLTDFHNSVISKKCPEIFELNSYRIIDCADDIKTTIANENYTNWSMKCDYEDYKINLDKLCACDRSSDNKLSIRTVSLREQLANSSNNSVVTGIRFAVKNNMITIEIQEGQLINGIVDPTSVKWKTDLGHLPKNGPDSVVLNYYSKSFDLDDIELPHGQFVTGVRFKIMGESHLTLSIRGTEMWDNTKSWPSTNSQWHESPIDLKDERIKVDITDFANSAEIKNQTTELSRSRRDYISLSVGLYSNEFNNLAVIPFFDSQDVVTEPPAPLGGVGLFYKGQLGFGGFLSLKYIASEYNYNAQAELDYLENHRL